MAAANNGLLLAKGSRISETPCHTAVHRQLAGVCLWAAFLDEATCCSQALSGDFDDRIHALQYSRFAIEEIKLVVAQTDEVLQILVASAHELKAASGVRHCQVAVQNTGVVGADGSEYPYHDCGDPNGWAWPSRSTCSYE